MIVVKNVPCTYNAVGFLLCLRLSVMRANVDPADQEFLRRLHQLGGGSVQQLCAVCGVTATAVRQRLLRMLSAGFVERQTIKKERGRPYHSYSVTAEGLQQLGDDYSGLVQVLWRELSEIEESDVRERVMGRIRKAFVDRYTSRDDGEHSAGSLRDRLEALGSELAEHGLQVEVHTKDSGGGELPVLREYFCPYHDVAVVDRSICELEQSVFGEVAGVPMKLSQCCHDGHGYCEFEPSLGAGVHGP
jgi:predicted ArsR family transcriptional regulator